MQNYNKKTKLPNNFQFFYNKKGTDTSNLKRVSVLLFLYGCECMLMAQAQDSHPPAMADPTYSVRPCMDLGQTPQR